MGRKNLHEFCVGVQNMEEIFNLISGYIIYQKILIYVDISS